MDNALATVSCSDGQFFVANCAPNGTKSRQVLPYDHADISTQCHVKCPAGETTFRLNGTLRYITHQHRFGHRQRTSENLIPEPEQFSFWADLSFDKFSPLLYFGKAPIILAIVVALLIGLVALLLFVKYSPMFVTYRLILRLFVGISMIKSATSLSSNFNSVHPSPPPKLIQMFNESSHPSTLHFSVFPIFFSFCVVLCTIWRFDISLRRAPSFQHKQIRQSLLFAVIIIITIITLAVARKIAPEGDQPLGGKQKGEDVAAVCCHHPGANGADIAHFRINSPLPPEMLTFFITIHT
ncbi:hypothetical protein niasHT_004023 [Heterodera trifolii]|uniref:Uncharacterized protein n=1 Tax=Heterodera trifolii TaxID=157864 RepID=A0ABD2LT75_9BILA